MADNTYGSRDSNIFNAKEKYNVNGKPRESKISLNSKFYLLVNSTSGEITIKEYNDFLPSKFGGTIFNDRTVGIIPKDGTFRPVSTVSVSEREYFSSAEIQRDIKNHAVTTSQKGGAKNAHQLIFPNTAKPGAGQGQNRPPESTVSTADPIGGDPENPGEESSNPPIQTADKFDLESIPPDLKDTQKEIVGQGNPPLRYPAKSTGGDVIKFTAANITRGRFAGDIGKLIDFEFPKANYSPVDGSVMLPIQAPTTDQMGVEWGPDSINAIDAFVFGLSMETIKASTKEGVTVADVGKTAYGKVIDAFKTQNERITKSFAGAAAGVNNILARTDNVVLNPNLELLFNSPQLRPFTFTFKLSARDNGEAKIIKQIIKYFKYHMVPRKEENALFLRSSNVFIIQYLSPVLDASGKVTGYQDHRGINKISGSTGDTLKACALTNCSVDYTPLGSYMTYNDQDKTMVAYTISLQFQELTPIYDTDYHDSWDHPIGY